MQAQGESKIELNPQQAAEHLAGVHVLLKALQDKIGEHPLLAEAILKVENGPKHSRNKNRRNVLAALSLSTAFKAGAAPLMRLPILSVPLRNKNDYSGVIGQHLVDKCYGFINN
jgi:hypothetical protein